MRKLLSLLVIVFLLFGCNSEFSFAEVSKKDVDENIQSFMDSVKEENGAHLYFEKPNVVYVYLNGSNIKQGEKAIYFTDFDVLKNDKALSVVYNTVETEDYSNPSLTHELLYKVNLDVKHETIKLYKNGKEDSCGTISGLGD